MANLTDWSRGQRRLVDECGNGVGRGMNGRGMVGKRVVKYSGNGSD